MPAVARALPPGERIVNRSQATLWQDLSESMPIAMAGERC